MWNRRGSVLISLIIGLAILGFLVAVVSLSTGKDMRLRAYQAAYRSDLQTLQSAVDAYYLDRGHYPTIGGQPSLGLPKALDIKELIPGYLSKEPELDLYRWVDHNGQVWLAAYDAPTDLRITGNAFEWKAKEIPSGFELFQESTLAQMGRKASQYVSIGRFDLSDLEMDKSNGTFKLVLEHPINLNSKYFIAAYGPLGRTPPVGPGYSGHPNPPQTDWSWLASKIDVGNNPPVDFIPPSEVTDLQVNEGENQLVITWREPADEDYNGVRIWWKKAADASYGSPVDLPKGTTTYVISGLENGVTYTIRISTVDTSGNV